MVPVSHVPGAQIELGQAYDNITGVRIWGPPSGAVSFGNITVYLSSTCGYLNGVVCATGVTIQSGVPVTAACTQTTSNVRFVFIVRGIAAGATGVAAQLNVAEVQPLRYGESTLLACVRRAAAGHRTQSMCRACTGVS